MQNRLNLVPFSPVPKSRLSRNLAAIGSTHPNDVAALEFLENPHCALPNLTKSSAAPLYLSKRTSGGNNLHLAAPQLTVARPAGRGFLV